MLIFQGFNGTRMKEKTLVSVHVRRTDYAFLLNRTAKITVPDENYYESAFQYFSDR